MKKEKKKKMRKLRHEKGINKRQEGKWDVELGPESVLLKTILTTPNKIIREGKEEKH